MVNEKTVHHPKLVETALVQRAQHGDWQALTELFDRFHQPLLNYLYHMLENRQEAEDIAQNAFLRAFERLDQLGPPWDFKSWLYRIASNLAVDYLRSERRYMSEEMSELDMATTTQRPIEQSLEREGQRQAIWKTLDALPTNYRQALILREMNSLSYQEIASTLQCTLESARQFVHRARLRFRDSYTLALLLAIRPPRCLALAGLISGYQKGEQPEPDNRAVQAHIASCDQCQQTRLSISKVGALLAGLPPFLPTGAWKTRVLEQVLSKPVSAPSPLAQQATSPEIVSGQPIPHEASVSRSYVQPSQLGKSSVPHLGRAASLGGKTSRLWLWLLLLFGVPLAGLLFLAAGLAFFSAYHYFLDAPATKAPISMLPSVEFTAHIPPSEPVFTPTSSPTITSSPVPTLTQTPTVVPTTSAPSATFRQNTHCRQGPSMDYGIVTSLLQGQTVLIEGRNQDSTWWWVRLPDSRAHCWVWSGLVETSGNPQSMPYISPPPKPPSIQSCWVFMPNQQKNVCVVPCPPNAQPGGACAP